MINPFENRVVYANQSAQTLFARTHQALLQASGSELFQPDISRLVVFTDEVLEKHQAWSSDLKIISGLKPIEVEVSASLLKQGDLLYIAMTLRHKKHLNKIRQASEVHRLHRDGLAYWKTIETVFR